MHAGCAISSERDDAATDATLTDAGGAPIDGADDDGGGVADVGPEDAPSDAGPPEPALRHLLLLYWPFGQTEWTPRRAADGMVLGPAMVGMRHRDLALITGLRAAPPSYVYDTHVDVPPSLWTGGTDRFAEAADAFRAVHASLDVVVARRFGGAPLVTRSSVRPYDTFFPAVSWAAPDAPSPLVLDARAAAAAVPCATRAFPELITASDYTFDEMTAVLDEQIRFAVEGFENGCLNVAALEIGDLGLRHMGQRVYMAMHDTDMTPIAAVIDALSRWLAGVLAELDDAGVLDDTLVVLTTQQGGELPVAHSFRELPVFLWSRAATLQPGWLELDDRPVRDWLHTVARAFGADGTFAAEGQPPGTEIDGLFVD